MVVGYPPEPPFSERVVHFDELNPTYPYDGADYGATKIESVSVRSAEPLWVAGFLARVNPGGGEFLMRQMKRYSPGGDLTPKQSEWSERFLRSTERGLRLLASMCDGQYPAGVVRVYGQRVTEVSGLALVDVLVERLSGPRSVPAPLSKRLLARLVLDTGDAVVSLARQGVLLIDLKLENVKYHSGRFRIVDFDSLTTIDDGLKHGMHSLETAPPEVLTRRDLPYGYAHLEDGLPLTQKTDLYGWALMILQAAGIPVTYPSASQRLELGLLDAPAQLDPANFSSSLPALAVPVLRRCLHLDPDYRPTLQEVDEMLAQLRNDNDPAVGRPKPAAEKTTFSGDTRARLPLAASQDWLAGPRGLIGRMAAGVARLSDHLSGTHERKITDRRD